MLRIRYTSRNYRHERGIRFQTTQQNLKGPQTASIKKVTKNCVNYLPTKKAVANKNWKTIKIGSQSKFKANQKAQKT